MPDIVENSGVGKKSPPQPVISGELARQLLAALLPWQAAVWAIKGDIPTTPQRNLLLERARPVFKAMKAAGICDQFAIDPASYADTWKRFFTLMSNWSYRYERPRRMLSPHPIARPTPEIPEIPEISDDDQNWRIVAGLASGPPPPPNKNETPPAGTRGANSGLNSKPHPNLIPAEKNSPAELFSATGSRARDPQDFCGFRAEKIKASLTPRRRGRSS